MTQTETTLLPVKEEVVKWYEALLVPGIRQTTGGLKAKTGERCCLGVYTEACGVPFQETGGYDSSYVLFEYEETRIAEGYVLPWPVAKRFWGISRDEFYATTDDNGGYDNPLLKIPPAFNNRKGLAGQDRYHLLLKTDEVKGAAELNDSYGFSFTEIAECTRYTWPWAFTE